VTGVRAAMMLAVAVVTLAGCSGAARPVGVRTIGPDPQRSALLQRAHLDPCPATTAVGVKGSLPKLTLPCLGDGPSVHLTGLRGTPTVLNIWGSWCTPCQAETPYLARAYDTLKPKVRFLGVDTADSSDSALDFAAHVSPPMTYPSVVDEDKKVLVALNLADAVPTTVFVTADGHVKHVSPGPYRSAQALLADIQRYLGVAP